jgi:hypothetical protein
MDPAIDSLIARVDRHDLSKMWAVFAKAYEPRQFHVDQSGLALLASYLLHSIDTMHSTVSVS